MIFKSQALNERVSGGEANSPRSINMIFLSRIKSMELFETLESQLSGMMGEQLLDK
jgi:hypothetical protein